MPRLTRARDATALASIVYRSRAVIPWSEAELLRLLEGARTKNALVGVTGVLVYDRRCFFQWLEGPQEGLTGVMNRVRGDPRHVDIDLIAHQPIPSRLFPDWSMNLAQRAPLSDATVEGLFRAESTVLDELHIGRPQVQMVLASMSVQAWEAKDPRDSAGA